MAATNTLTSIAPVLYSAAQEVSAEPFALVTSINTSFDNKGVAKGNKVPVPVAPTRAGQDFEPAATAPAGLGAVASSVDVEITKSRKVSWNLTGEQLRSLENGGTNTEWVRQLVAQGMRTLRNEAEEDVAGAIKVGASRAYGTAGTTPFETSLSDLVQVRKILRDNGAPMADLQLVVDTNAEVNLLNLGIIQQANVAGSDEERRQGRINRQFGFRIEQSAGISQHTSGDWTSGNGTVADIGATSAAITHTDGQFLAGDIISLADISGKYVVNAADDTANTVTINRPGFLAAGSTKAVTLTDDYTPSFAFERNAVVGVVRPPLIPANPTMKQMIISDNMGMSYLLVEVAQYGQVSWEIHLAWGFKVVQPEHVAILIG